MPLFNEASRIYNPLEVNFMCSCFSNAAIMLERATAAILRQNWHPASIMLYESGLRDQSYISELAARLAHQRYQTRHDIQTIPAAKTNSSAQAMSTVPAEYDPFA
ncbi:MULTISPECIES: hypothetical protein [Brucella]|uniref:hypothetical protein n=1 Tax=Brucella TaxID=234 RepID=UPI000B99953B|nr:hypothetical protein [Brucella lupini]